MLDNTLTTATNTTMPMDILADAKVLKNKQQQQHQSSEDKLQNSTLTKTNKTKTILNWLKNTTTNTKSNNLTSVNRDDISSCHHNHFDTIIRQSAKQRQEEEEEPTSSDCTCPTVKQQNSTRFNKSLTSSSLINNNNNNDDTLREFRGVQTLKHLWNKRITANKESALRAKDCKHPNKQFTKSVSCLLNAFNNTGEPPPSPLRVEERSKARKLRALSLHDCSRLSRPESLAFDEITLSEIEIQRHLEKDNFYKYKTAEQASKLRELSEHSTARRLSNGIVIPKPERLNWLKRHDIFNNKKKTVEEFLTPSHSLYVKRRDFDNASKQNISAVAPNDDDDDIIIINEHNIIMHSTKDSLTLPTATSQQCNEVDNTATGSSESSTPTLTATNSPLHVISRRSSTKRKDSSKSLVSASSISRDSSAASLTLATGQRSHVKRNTSARKYSFKTHSRSYHAPRKMHTNKDNSAPTTTTTGQVTNPPNSLVAKLTQQFNEIIQKDKTLLEEIKRKNGVLMTHKGHVYKVVDTGSMSRNGTTSLSRSSSKTHDSNDSDLVKQSIRSSSSTVQKNIKKFESESRGLKPKVPLKSINVLRKSNELVIKNIGTGCRQLSNKSIQKVESETKVEVKPNSLNISSSLEMVQEEAKTPVKSKDLVGKQNEKKNDDNPDSKKNRDARIDPEKEVISRKTQREDKTLKEATKILEIYTNNSPSRSTIEIEKEEISAKDIQDSMSCVEKIRNSLTDISNISNSNSQDQQTTIEILQSKEVEEDVRQDNENKENKITNKQKSQLNFNNKKNKQGDENEKFPSNESVNKQIQIPFDEDFYKCPEVPAEIPSEDNAKVSNERNVESPEHYEDEDKPKRKHKYAKIYEKLRFFTPFSHSNKNQKLTTSDMNKSKDSSPEKSASDDLRLIQNPEYICKEATSEKQSPDELKVLQNPEYQSKELTPEKQSPDELKPLKTPAYTPMNSPPPKLRRNLELDYSIMSNPEAKILEALEKVDEKLQNLNHDKKIVQNLESDEFGQPLKPNSSFLHQIPAKEIEPKPVTLIQAVNVTLVNAIEGEQMIMEQKEIQEEKLRNLNENEATNALHSTEPLYEPICTVKIDEIRTETCKTPSAVTLENCEFSLTRDLSDQTANIIEEDIYQTVDEVQMEYSKLISPEIIITTKPELDGYEPIENPSDIPVLSLKCDISAAHKIIHFDGYEECTPPVEVTPITPTTLGVRKVTDQLPDIPQPKRIFQKSPVPCRTAPKPPLPMKHNQIEEDNESVTSPLLESNYEFESVDENIYDTIKGIHCYESLQSYNNKLENCTSTTIIGDCVSLSSNCYESIPHYKRNTINGRHHSGGSSNGSTATISSDHNTNSLYDGSLTCNLQYSSKRIYRSTLNGTHVEINKSIKIQNVNGVYAGSIGRTSDTSDEWTDVTDNENGDEECDKPQFIIVRERSKVHKSPDWSRRVRDKRQRKSKSCIEDDDPDHYYEQLSPQALSKRHPSLEQTHTNSLQRNQDIVRISKRNKQISCSAQALGQHISDDSFDSDTDYYESEHFKNSHNDSGVDVRNRCKLPEPPSSSSSSSNQMYAIVKKFKNFIVNKKSPNSSKHGGSQQKIYDNSSQFYVSGQYEGKPSSLQVPATKELSTSEKNLIMAQSAVSKPEPVNASTTPRKPKSGKSFRSRLRKSLVGFDNKQLSTLTPTRSTFYIEDPGHDDSNGQLDSGFSEKALSGELPTTNASTLPPSPESPKFSTVARKSKKDTKLANSQRRRTIVGIRPNDPPPPPPPTENATQTKRLSNTSWYAECGVFKNGTTNLVHDDSQILNSRTGGSGSSFVAGSTWYEEAGLYQTSGVSVASSSGSSGVSTSNEAGTSDEMSHSMFSNEPLYQIYSAAKLEAISRDMQDESSTDGYEEIGDRNKSNTNSEGKRKSSRPSALQLVEPKSGPERTLWCHIPEVINSFIIPTMTPRERALMEAKFEIITSEASYLKSLNLLRTHYMNHPIFRDQNIVSSRDRKFLFAHIVPVHECSEKLLTELESCWQDNIMLVGLSKRIYAIAEKHFHVYIGFCEHQGRMDRTLKLLREGKGLFSQNLELLESSPSCCGLNLHSFLMLPMQRITRLPLLIDAVFSKCHPNDDEYENWKMCLAMVNKIVTHCNEAANKSDQAFEIERISRQLEFNPSSIRPLAIAPAGVLAPGTKPRFLVKKGELTHLIWRGDEAKLTFGKKFSKTTIFAFLFSDLLVLTKRKADEHFSVFDYCPRNMLTITSGDTLPQLPTKDFNSQTNKNLILMTLLENHERKTVELLLSCPSVSEQERWLQAMRPPESETPGEKLYEQWDCPQVMAKHLYENNEPDVLNLEVGDVVNVTRKLPDGWYKGERIRDGAVGWFPGSYTEEVNSVHVRARNLKQRHRLLTFTATYLESQKRNK